jgi:glycosyltransferase involved in cell wall biosynthesis
MPRVSVIVSTCNRPDSLRAVLEGYGSVGFHDFEVVVADDGSEPETGNLIRSLARESRFPLTHVRQPKDGFRLAAARNLGVRAARGDVILFTDGDCVPLPDFLEAHADRCAPGRALAGARCNLDPGETAFVLQAGALPPGLDTEVRRRETPRLRRRRWKDRLYALARWKPRPKLETSNASVHRDDFEMVNGFDERFVGWGYEDEDLARRLRRRGVKVEDASGRSLVLHLFHAVHESHRPDARSGANYRYFQTQSFLTRPLHGLRRREAASLSLELAGAVPPDLAGVPGAGAGERAEVAVVFPGTSLSPRRPRAEVVVRVPPGHGIASIEALYRLLEKELGPFGETPVKME